MRSNFHIAGVQFGRRGFFTASTLVFRVDGPVMWQAHNKTMGGPERSPTRHSQVSGYTSKSITTTSTRPSAMICLAVNLTTSESSNMDYSRSLRSLGPQRPRKRTLVGGYVVRFGRPAPTVHLTTDPWSSYFHGASPEAHLQVLAHNAAQRVSDRGCEFQH